MVAAIVIILPLFFPSAYYYRIGALVFIFALAVVGLNLLMGFAGQVSLGHAGFLGIGAYSVAIGPVHFGAPSWLCLFAGAMLSGAVAFAVGRPILRLKGHYLAVATLGFGLLVAIVLTNEAGWTGGPDGMSVPALTLFGWRVHGSDAWYWIAGATFVGGFLLALNLMESPTGRALQAIHDSEIAARVLGIDVARKKLIVFIISAMYASVAGSYLALFNGLVTPDDGGIPAFDRIGRHGRAGRHGVDIRIVGGSSRAGRVAAGAHHLPRIRAGVARTDRDGFHDLSAPGHRAVVTVALAGWRK